MQSLEKKHKTGPVFFKIILYPVVYSTVFDV
jgi:hypothetical protein